MKLRTLIIFFVILLLSGNSFPQFHADTVISEYVREFMRIADDETKLLKEANSHEITREISDSEIEDITRLYYKSFDEDPVGFNTYLEKEFRKWNANRNILEFKPAMKVKLLVKRIAKKYGIPFTEIISTPAFLRCKFISLSSSYYTIGIRNSNFNFVVEDILKGDKFFKIGDTLTIKMIPNIECPIPDLQVGDSYLIPVGTNLGLGNNSFNNIFKYLQDRYDVWEMGVPPKIFHIQNEIIKDCNYFGFPEMNWNAFKEYFKNKFLIFN